MSHLDDDVINSSMPKLRQTCTRCSMRRQKCDRKDPCTRCVQNNEASSCSRKWPHNYDPRIHRTYPKTNLVRPALNRQPCESTVSGFVPQNDAQAAPLEQNVANVQHDSSSQPTIQELYSNIVGDQLPEALRRTNDEGRAAPTEPGLLRAGNDPTSLEFLTNGIIKPSDFDPNSIQPSTNADANAFNPAGASGLNTTEACPRAIQKHYLQTLLPTARQTLQLVDFHEECLIWYHRCVHGPTFRKDLLEASQASNGLQLKHLDLRWCALLFSIMAASLTCASHSITQLWGFSKPEKDLLSNQWYKAAISCLYLGEHSSKLHVYSIQAIEVMTMAAHMLGFSNEQFILFGTALRISQSLGLQRLTHDTELDSIAVIGTETWQDRQARLIKREMGRRIWIQICSQDWFSIPSIEMYSVSKRQFTTIKPKRFDDGLILVGGSVALVTDVGNYMFDIASLLVDFHDSEIASVTLADKYEQVLKFDSKLRALGAESMPESFSPSETDDPARPRWQAWARGAAIIAHAHKIIMIHRHFLGKSFIDPRFTYTRWASITASRTILREVELGLSDVERPMIWTDQAFMVAAGITLCLDVLHRTETEPEFAEHRQLVEKAIFLLSSYDGSTLALRGIRLLSSLLTETKNKLQHSQHRTDYGNKNSSHSDDLDSPAWHEKRRTVDPLLRIKDPSSGGAMSNPTVSTIIPEPVGAYHSNATRGPGTGASDTVDVPSRPANDDYFNFSNPNNSGTINDNGFMPEVSWTELFSDYFPAQSGFESSFLIEDLFN